MANENFLAWEPTEMELDWLESHKQVRSYEVSIWTLQDDFITVLKYANLENKGQIQEGKVKLNVDGTQEFTFKIPMYLYDYNGNVLEENPIWYQKEIGNIAIDMRKAKVIFNKEESNEKVFEFLITKIDESHSSDQLFCEVSCEGLAFHELGKIGYKVSLTPDDFYNDDYDWFKNNYWTDTKGVQHSEQPLANLQYWLNKFLSNTFTSPNEWYYSIEMNYDAFPNGYSRASNVVYEEAYPSSWRSDGTNLTVLRTEEAQEKARLVDLSESNVYNLTQNLAETFEVFCRYEYEHDKNYHIIGRKIIFYNNFIYENEGYIDFTYPFSTSEISREMDSTDLVTKMFVKAVEDDTTASGLLTIINTEANNSGEDYLLNFDYLHSIKAISEEQYAEVSKYEARMKQLNQELAPLESQIVALSAQLPTLEAKLKIASNAIQLDTERIGAASDLFNAITEGDGEIEITAMNPATAILLKDQSDEVNNSYYINLTKHGIDSNSIRIFRYFDVQIGEDFPYDTYGNEDAGAETQHNGRLYVELKTGYPETDEFGDVTKIRNLYLNADERKTVFLTYNYTPKLYYDRVVETWTNRLAKDTADKEKYENEINSVKTDLEAAETAYDAKIAEKNIEIKKFEHAMGPALREGYWNPEDYKDCGDKYTDEITITSSVTANQYDHRKSTNNAAGQKELLNYFIWDSDLFNSEFDAVYTADTVGNKKKYPCIDLSHFSKIFSPNLSLNGEEREKELKNRIDNLSFFFCDYNGYQNDGVINPDPGKMRAFAVGSQCQYGFIKKNGLVIPVLILNGMETIPESVTIKKVQTEKDEEGNVKEIGWETRTENMLDFLMSHAMKLGMLKVDTSSNKKNIVFEDWSVTVTSNDWITDYECTVYPRMVITSLAVKTSSDQLYVTYAKKEIKNVEDYYCLSKIPTGSSEANYYITLKPQTIFRLGGTSLGAGIFGVKYTISNADTSIYLDAKQILKENAYPRVSYTIKLSTLNRAFLNNAYNRLCYIAHINDAELKFQNTMGYISQVDLDLDKPWEDEVEVKNYKTKFEDLFSTILASTEEMKKSGYALRAAASAFDAWGSIKPWALEGTIYKVDLDYAFNQGTLTITEKDGIWGVSESGVVAIRGGGIFTSTEQDGNGNWKWNTGITPEGINATLITAGQLDTNRVMVYAGDKLRFQLNGEGLFAYKSFFEDLDTINDWVANPSKYSIGLQTTHNKRMTEINEMLAKDENSDLDAAQFVKMDSNGLFLVAKEGALVLNSDKSDYIKIGEMLFEWVDTSNHIIETYISKDGVERASLTWDGFTLRNYYNQKVLYANADTGDLQISGSIFASELNIGGESSETSLSLNQYIESADKLIIEGFTTTNIAKIKAGVTTIFYLSESDLINYLDDGLYAKNSDPNKKQGKDGDIWYNTRSPKKELTVFEITDISSSPRTRKAKDGTDLPHTEYDYWKMQQLESKDSDFSFAKALMGIYQSNIEGTKYSTIYKVAHTAATRTVQVLVASSSASGTIVSGGHSTSASTIQPGEAPTDLGADTSMTITYSDPNYQNQTQNIPIEEQTPLLPSGITNNNLKFGDIWINTSVTPNAIYRWDSDYNNEKEELNNKGDSTQTTQVGSKGKWILLTGESSIASQDRVLYDLQAAEGKVARIANGEYGLIFSGAQTITDIQLNRKVGLQIKSRDGAYFRVNSSQFGFVSADGKTPYLYYENGNLFIMGTIFAKRFYVLDGLAQYNFYDYLGYHFENYAKISTTLKDIFDEAGEILNQAQTTLNNIGSMTLENSTILGGFLQQAQNLQPTVYTSSTRPSSFKPGDIWNPTSGEYAGNHYIAMSFSGNSSATTSVPLGGWNKVVDGSIASISGAGMNVDAAAGTIDMYAGSKITLRAKSQLDLASGDIQITGNNSINIGSKWINIGSANGGINIVSTNIDNNTTTGEDGKVNTTGVISKVQIDRAGIIMHGNSIELMAGDTSNVAAMRFNPQKGIWLGSSQEIRLFSGTANQVNQVLNDNTSEADLAAGSSVLINKDKILYGVSGVSGSATGVELTKDYMIFAAGNAITALETEGATPESTNTSGVKITKDNIWLATGTGTNRSLIKMGEKGIRLGSTDSAPTGSYVDITQNDGITIAAGSTGSSAGSMIVIKPHDLIMTTAGQIQLYGNSGEIIFGLDKATPYFRVTPNGDVYCQRLHVVDGISTSVSAPTNAQAIYDGGSQSYYLSHTYGVSNTYTFNFGTFRLPALAKYTFIFTLTKGSNQSAYFQHARVTFSGSTTTTDSSFAYNQIDGDKDIVYELTADENVSSVSIRLTIEDQTASSSISGYVSLKIYRDFKGSSTSITVQGEQGQDGSSYTYSDTYSDRQLVNLKYGWFVGRDYNNSTLANPSYMVYRETTENSTITKTAAFSTYITGRWNESGSYKVYSESGAQELLSITPTLSLGSSSTYSETYGNVLNSSGITPIVGTTQYYPIQIVESSTERLTKYIKINAAPSTTSTLSISGDGYYSGAYYNISPTTSTQYITVTMSGASNDTKTIRIYGASSSSAWQLVENYFMAEGIDYTVSSDNIIVNGEDIPIKRFIVGDYFIYVPSNA